MKTSCMVLLCTVFIISLNSVAFAQTDCLAKQFDPQGGLKCIDSASAASHSSTDFTKNDSNEETQSVKDGGYFKHQGYFGNKDYFDQARKNNRSDYYSNPSKYEATGTNKSLGNE